MRIKEQETCLTPQEHDDDDDEHLLYLTAHKNLRRFSYDVMVTNYSKQGQLFGNLTGIFQKTEKSTSTVPIL